jgi:hypothetical protein
MSCSEPSRVWWGIRTRRRQQTFLAIGLACCVLSTVLGWAGGDAITGVISAVGVVILAAILVASWVSRA